MPAFPLNGSADAASADAAPNPSIALRGWNARLAPVRYGADTLIVLDRER